jgi:hypothetical protein
MEVVGGGGGGDDDGAAADDGLGRMAAGDMFSDRTKSPFSHMPERSILPLGA